jgi:predicted DNA-binding WGR domain protein
MDTCHLVQQSSIGRIKFITLEVIGDTLYREWGLLGGKTQQTENTYDYKNQGRKNELTPEQVAEEDYHRIISKKVKNGYRQVDSLDGVTMRDAELDSIDFDNPPTSFAPSKPITSIEDSVLNLLLKSGQAEVQLKENGMCHFIFIGSKGKVRIFTRKMLDHTRKYPDIVKVLENMIKVGTIPKKTVMATEFVVDYGGQDHRHAFRLMQQMSRSDCSGDAVKENIDRTLELQEENDLKVLVYYIYYWGGDAIWKQNAGYVLDRIKSIFPEKYIGTVFYSATPMNFKNSKDIDLFLEDYKGILEGLVVWDKSDIVKIEFSGKPKRRACYKEVLPLLMDVVAYDYLPGSGKRQGHIGSILIGKYNEAGELVPIGRVGSGLTDETMEINYWNFPEVIEVEYREQFPTGKLQFPVLIKKHEDKTPDECVLEEGEITE